MRVDDIDRSSEVTTAFTLIEHTPGADVGAIVQASQVDAKGTYTVECGDKTAEALRSQAWGTLHQMTPPSLRTKNPAKAAAAKKAAATKQAKREAATPPSGPQGAPEAGAGAEGAGNTAESASGAASGQPEGV